MYSQSRGEKNFERYGIAPALAETYVLVGKKRQDTAKDRQVSQRMRMLKLGLEDQQRGRRLEKRHEASEPRQDAWLSRKE